MLLTIIVRAYSEPEVACSGRKGLQAAGALDGKRISRPSPLTHSESTCPGRQVKLLHSPSAPQRAGVDWARVPDPFTSPPLEETCAEPELVTGRDA